MIDNKRGNGEGSVYQEGAKRARVLGTECDGRWVAQIVIDGKLRRSFHPTEAKAKTGLRSMQSAAATGVGVADGNLTVTDVLTRWQTRVLAGRNSSPKTIETYNWCIERIKDEIGSRRVRSLDVDAVEAALDRMAAGDKDHPALGKASLIKVRSVLGQAFDFALKRQWVTRNVVRLAELTPDAKRPKERRALTAEQAKKLLEQLRGDRLEAFFAIMLTVGLRPGEAAGLQWEDVDLDAGRIGIRSGVRVENNRAVLVDELKTKRARRTIDLPAYPADALRRHRLAQNRERLAATAWADERLVFTSNNGNVLDPHNVARVLSKHTNAAGLGKWSPNELRHTAASLLSAEGVPLEYIADLLGHTNTRMLESNYRHSVQPSIGAAVAAMDKLIG